MKCTLDPRRRLLPALAVAFAIASAVRCQGGAQSNAAPASKPEPTAQVVGPSRGESAELPGVAAVEFPPGAFPRSTTVRLLRADAGEFRDVFEETTAVYGTLTSLPYAIRVITGASAPTMPAQASMVLPREFAAANAKTPEVFVRLLEGGDGEFHDIFERFESTPGKNHGELKFSIPVAAFSNEWSKDGSFEAMVTIAFEMVAAPKSEIPGSKPGP